jgi:hypothetical protein
MTRWLVYGLAVLVSALVSFDVSYGILLWTNI